MPSRHPNATSRETLQCGGHDGMSSARPGCGIFIFSSPAEAAAHGVTYDERINHRHGRFCPGCAGGDTTGQYEKEHITAMANTHKTFSDETAREAYRLAVHEDMNAKQIVKHLNLHVTPAALYARWNSLGLDNVTDARRQRRAAEKQQQAAANRHPNGPAELHDIMRQIEKLRATGARVDINISVHIPQGA